MTNRIWVTTENIYQLFQKKAEAIYKEMSKNHIEETEVLIENV